MKCPNCGNTEKFQEDNIGIKIFKNNINKKVYCLRCGFHFSKEIEQRYGDKNE